MVQTELIYLIRKKNSAQSLSGVQHFWRTQQPTLGHTTWSGLVMVMAICVFFPLYMQGSPVINAGPSFFECLHYTYHYLQLHMQISQSVVTCVRSKDLYLFSVQLVIRVISLIFVSGKHGSSYHVPLFYIWLWWVSGFITWYFIRKQQWCTTLHKAWFSNVFISILKTNKKKNLS